MSVKIMIPTPLRQYVDDQSSVEVQAETVGAALEQLVQSHPDLKKHLMTESGELRNFVNIYVNDEDMRYLRKKDTAIKSGDTLMIIPSIAGGS